MQVHTPRQQDVIIAPAAFAAGTGTATALPADVETTVSSLRSALDAADVKNAQLQQQLDALTADCDAAIAEKVDAEETAEAAAAAAAVAELAAQAAATAAENTAAEANTKVAAADSRAAAAEGRAAVAESKTVVAEAAAAAAEGKAAAAGAENAETSRQLAALAVKHDAEAQRLAAAKARRGASAVHINELTRQLADAHAIYDFLQVEAGAQVLPYVSASKFKHHSVEDARKKCFTSAARS